MFSLDQILHAHSKVKSGADFPFYIQELKDIGITAYETWVIDSHTKYIGKNNFQLQSKPKYEALVISDTYDSEQFIQILKAHQLGHSDYSTFCSQCAETGIEKWIVNLETMTCIYFDKSNNQRLVEQVPTV